MIVVSDTSAITSLLQVGRAALLEDLYQEVLIPEAVQKELLRVHPSLPSFLHSEAVLNDREVQRLLAELDLGEAEAIALAKERKADLLLMDELEGRRVARREGVRYVGLLGVLIQARQLGKIASLRQVITDLETIAGFHLSEEIKAAAFTKVGEL